MVKALLYQNGKVSECALDEALTIRRQDEAVKVWIDMANPSLAEVNMLSEEFNFHPLAIEDCLGEVQSPKVDDYDEHLFIVVHAVNFEAPSGEFATSELDVFLGDNYLVTSHRVPKRSVEVMREKCQKNPESFAKGVDHLLYSILDALADSYISVLRGFDDSIDELEEEIFKDPREELLERILDIRRDILYIRRIITPQRDVINLLSRAHFKGIKEDARVYFRDVYDALQRITGLTENYRDLLSNALDAYLSLVSHRMNRVVKILTVVTTLMMPLTLVTGIYGMNFKFMPELQWHYGYFVVLGGMFALLIGMLFFMKRQKWL